MHTPTAILMIRPAAFAYNLQTAASNAFQHENNDQQEVQQKALAQFDNFVAILKTNGVDVIVLNDTPQPHTPDAIFPNNWVSFHSNGNIFLYPMQAENRRLERREDIIRQLENRFKVNHIIDLSRFELQNKFLEGTGSMVLDRANRLAYACISPRTDAGVLNEFCKQAGYTAITFHAVDKLKRAIYHTNVMMCVAEHFAVICLESITDPAEREAVVQSLQHTGKIIVSISIEQMNSFAGNMLEVFNNNGKNLLIMSGSAYGSLSDKQIGTLQQFSRIIHADISTIEQNGGGSVRCMMAEVQLPFLSEPGFK